VDDVLAGLPTSLREACDRAGILDGLQTVGACSVPLLCALLEGDYAAVKSAIGTAAKAAFVVLLKGAVLDAVLQSPTPATPAHRQRHASRRVVLLKGAVLDAVLQAPTPATPATPAPRELPSEPLSNSRNAACPPRVAPFHGMVAVHCPALSHGVCCWLCIAHARQSHTCSFSCFCVA
jgi:hypothetical protein